MPWGNWVSQAFARSHSPSPPHSASLRVRRVLIGGGAAGLNEGNGRHCWSICSATHCLTSLLLEDRQRLRRAPSEDRGASWMLLRPQQTNIRIQLLRELWHFFTHFYTKCFPGSVSLCGHILTHLCDCLRPGKCDTSLSHRLSASGRMLLPSFCICTHFPPIPRPLRGCQEPE